MKSVCGWGGAPKFFAAFALGSLLAACGQSADPTSASAVEARRESPDKDHGHVYLPEVPLVRAKAAGDGPAAQGTWSPVIDWPIIGIHTVVMPDGRVLTYGTDTGAAKARQTAYFSVDIWNPAAGFGPDSHLTVPNNTLTDIFCGSQVVLPQRDAGVLINGGDNWTGTTTTNTGNNNSNVFSYTSNTLSRGSNMNRLRWYSTSTTLINGEVYVQGGMGGTDFPEVRGLDGNFRLLTGADTSAFDFTYPRNFVAPDGRLFGMENVGAMYYVDTSGLGAVTNLVGTGNGAKSGKVLNAVRGVDSSTAMFRPGRILTIGGHSALSAIIDITGGGAPVVTMSGATFSERKQLTATLLADGTVLATGGSKVRNELVEVNNIAERWDPRTGTWLQGSVGALARLYHSTAVLLPDATVLVAGGGAPGPLSNRNVEVYSPPYLYNASGALASRPVISSAPAEVQIGRSFELGIANATAVSRVTLVKNSSVTHSFNMEQRFVELPFTASGSQLSVQMPHRPGEAPPGYYMVFVFDDKGVPSTAKMVWINVAQPGNPAQAPSLSAPGNQTGTGGVALSVALLASDPNNDVLRYSAGGLPPGLRLDPQTGVISGKPLFGGTYYPIVAVNDGFSTSTASFVWQITGDAPTTPEEPPPPPPVELSPISPPSPRPAASEASYTVSSSRADAQYKWSFGDGTPDSAYSSSPSVTHTFTKPGVFTVTVTAVDPQGVQVNQSFTQIVHLPLTTKRPTASSSVALESPAAGAQRVWVVNPDNDSVSVFDVASGARLAEVTVGLSPRSVAVAANGMIWVTNRLGPSVSVIDPATLAVFKTISLPRASQPQGIAMSPAGDFAYIVLSGLGQVTKYATANYARKLTTAVGPDPRQVSVSADGATAWVTRFITPPQPGEGTATVQTTLAGTPTGGEVVKLATATLAVNSTVVLRHSDKQDFESQGRGVPNYLGAAVISPDGTQAWVPSKQDNIQRGLLRDGNNLDFQNTVRAISSRIDLSTGREDYAGRIDHDNASLASAGAFERLGVFLFVALETSREVAVIDAHRRVERFRFDVGRAPQGLAVSADGLTLYVSNFMDRSLSVFDLRPLIQQGKSEVAPVAVWPTVGTEKLTAQILVGKQLFYDARDLRLAADRYMSCAVCHNDGGGDGRVWDLTGFGEGLRNTVSLRGRAGAQGYLHWSGNFDEVQDFEGQIRSLSGGRGLMNDADFLIGTRAQPLGTPKAGVSADLDALAAYVASLNKFEDSPFRASASALTAAGTAGKTTFTNLGCGSCHGSASFTGSGIATLVDVGTLKPSSGQRLGGPLTGIDVPTLRDVWATAPYLHDGSAPTVEDAIRAHTTVTVPEVELSNLATYVKSIGREEAAPVLPAAGGTGLRGRYYNTITLTGPEVLTRDEIVDFSSSASWGAGVNADNFSVRWSGKLRPALTGSYRFQTVSNDGIRLWINGTLVINNWVAHAANVTDTSAPLTLLGGRDYEVVLEYYDKAGTGTARLRWQTPGVTSYVAIPLDRLLPPG